MSLNNSLGASYIVFSVLHFILLVLAAIVAGLYGTDFTRAKDEDGAYDSRWIFAVVIAALSAFTTVLYLIPSILRCAFIWVWDLVLFVLWIAVFGVFARIYVNEPTNGDGAISRMKVAVWFDLANALLWLIVGLAAIGYWRGHRERKTRFTGRAKVY